ncbi:MAG: ABC transporter permease, partial [Starkeya sp.]|nr:ABC transporter permease [Starkeya sp.]
MSTSRRLLLTAASLLALLLFWQVAALWAQSRLLPGPLDVFAAMLRATRTGLL